MDRYQETLDRVSVVKRILKSVQSDDYIPGRPRCWGLAAEEFKLVTMGYACFSCLACWEPLILEKCPMCGAERNSANFVVERPDWQEYERHREKELANPTPTRLKPMHQLAEELSEEALEGHMPGVKRNL